MSHPHDPECVRLLERVSEYLDHAVDEATCRAIEAHVRACPSCAAVIDGLRRTVGLCRETGDRPVPAAVKARAQASISRLLGTKEPAGGRTPRKPDRAR